MKIEIGESLVSSYLSHVEGCRIVQTNWKRSGNWEEGEYLKKESESLYNKVTSNPNFIDIFKKASFDSFIKQGEIDVLGINTIENSIYAYDIAFHSAGLNYKGGKSTKVIIKIFRAICTAKLYFSEYQTINSFFVTPKCGESTRKEIEENLNILSDIINDNDVNIRLICNDVFYDEIYDPTISALRNENNSNELFDRALKLINSDKRKKSTISSSNKEVSVKVTSGGMKIGQYVQELFHRLNNEKTLLDSEIIKLQDKDYCKKVFNSSFPVLITNTRSPRDKNNRLRYYAKEIFDGYWLSSQWIDKQFEYLKKWEKSIK